MPYRRRARVARRPRRRMPVRRRARYARRVGRPRRIYRRPVRRLKGRGSYRIRGKKVAVGQGIPHFGSGAGSIRIRHREFISDITMAAGGALRTFLLPLNPGIAATFPWLSSIADNFQEWKPHGMVFEYISTSANALTGTNTALGVVVLSTEYNAAYPGWNNNPVSNPYATKQQAENAQFSVSGKPSQNLMHAIECARHQTVLPEMFVRIGSVPANTDPRVYDLGMMQVTTLSSQASQDYAVGELWLTYDISLLKPVQGAVNALLDHFNFSTSGVNTSAYFGAASSNGLVATSGSTLGGSCVGGTFSASSAGIYNFPNWCRSGAYLVMYSAVGSSSLLTPAITFTNGSNFNSLNLMNADQGNFLRVTGGANLCTTQLATELIQFNGSTTVGQSWVGVSAGGLPAAPTSSELWVIGINAPSQ